VIAVVFGASSPRRVKIACRGGWPATAASRHQILHLYDATPERYRVALTLGSAQALRIGEALAIEESPRCLDFDIGKLHVVQQLRYNAKFGGFFLKEPRAGSSGTIDFKTDAMVAVQNHINTNGSTEVELIDAVDPTHVP